MYKIAFIDDSEKQFNLFSRRLKKLEKQIDLVFVEDCKTCEDISEWIIEKNIECLLVDYKLVEKYGFTGAKLINFLNSKIPSFPCIVLTSYPEDAEDEKLVMKPLIFDKNIIIESQESDRLREFIIMLIHSVEVFRKRLVMNQESYKILMDKNKKSELTSKEYEEFEFLFKMLRAYGIIDDVSIVSINKKFNNQIDELMCKIDKLIDK